MIPELVAIPGGTFYMGARIGSDDEKPVHGVIIDPLFIGKYTITNREFDLFLSESKYQYPRDTLRSVNLNHPQQPATCISWLDAKEYCTWLSAATHHHYRLPTEAEWEYVATSGLSQNVYPWGIRTWEELPEFQDRFQKGPEQVGLFEPNGFGVHDMGFNVHEWCLDWYGADFYEHSPAHNPKGPEKGIRRASRGGSWRHQVKITRCAARSSIPPEYRYADYGFRIVRALD